MTQVITATYKNGAFVPDEECDLPENARVRVLVENDAVIPPTITGEAEKQAVLDRMQERRRNNPIPPNAPKFTRDELHDRG